MYRRTLDDFEYRDIQFRWVLSPNRFIYRVYREQELIGTIPVSQVRARMLPSAIEALYPICDKWLGSIFQPRELPTEDEGDRATLEAAIPSPSIPVSWPLGN